uniref:Leucine-rich repeat-containing protein 18-like n=1 Tax=Petromyzon marinus TaxID=7757 RepID=A0AAJ7TVT4_PETMA|nr:leucine-rich repeat-containing protein 18-like [Petromyzon marinus]
MPKKKGPKRPKGTKVTLAMAQNRIRTTLDGKRRLDLSNMGIASFPKSILKLSDVEELDLSRNVLRSLPDAVGRFQNLRWLDVHSNRLEKVPPAVGSLLKLVHLNLCNNRLTADGLPRELAQLRVLRNLNLGLNALERLPGWLAALKELTEIGLFDNRLKGLPDAVVKLPKIQRLNVKRNPFPEPTDEAAGGREVERERGLLLVPRQVMCSPCREHCEHERERIRQLREAALAAASAAAAARRPRVGAVRSQQTVSTDTQADTPWK